MKDQSKQLYKAIMTKSFRQCFFTILLYRGFLPIRTDLWLRRISPPAGQPFAHAQRSTTMQTAWVWKSSAPGPQPHVLFVRARSLIMIIFEWKHPLGASNKTLYAFIYKLRSQPSAPEFVLGAYIYTYFHKPERRERERKAEREMLWPEKHPWENSFRGLFTQHKESPANHQQWNFYALQQEKREEMGCCMPQCAGTTPEKWLSSLRDFNSRTRSPSPHICQTRLHQQQN